MSGTGAGIDEGAVWLMSIPFSCPYCGLYTLVDDEFAGHSGPCAACGKTVVVPYVAANYSAPTAGSPPRQRSRALTVILAVVGSLFAGAVVISVLVALLVPAVGLAKRSQAKRNCSENLRKIGMALQQYHQMNGTYPPAYLTDAAGKPMHSWRVLLLPYVGQKTLYDQYDFSQPWDSPQNKSVLNRMPDVYACPGDEDAKVLGETSYVVVVGAGTMFPGRSTTTNKQVTDDPAHTLAVVESHQTGICWLEPKDMDVARLHFALSEAGGTMLGGNHDGGVEVLMADGTTFFLKDSASEDYLQSMATIRGGEVIPWEVLDQ